MRELAEETARGQRGGTTYGSRRPMVGPGPRQHGGGPRREGGRYEDRGPSPRRDYARAPRTQGDFPRTRPERGPRRERPYGSQPRPERQDRMMTESAPADRAERVDRPDRIDRPDRPDRGRPDRDRDRGRHGRKPFRTGVQSAGEGPPRPVPAPEQPPLGRLRALLGGYQGTAAVLAA